MQDGVAENLDVLVLELDLQLFFFLLLVFCFFLGVCQELYGSKLLHHRSVVRADELPQVLEQLTVLGDLLND